MKNRHDSGAAETPEQIIEHISRLMAEAEAMIAGPVTEKAGGKLDELKDRLVAARDRLNEAYSSARETIGDAYHRTRKNVVAGARQTDEAIRENPYQSMAIALGVGVLFGVLIGRKTR